MLRSIPVASLLIMLSAGMAGAQTLHPPKGHLIPASVAVTYNAERTKIDMSHCGCFWFQGAAADADWEAWKSLGIAAQVSGAHAADIAPGVSANKIDFLLGPRYTWQPASAEHRSRGTSIFGEFLLGGVHVFDAVIPTSSGVTSSATAFAFQTGAGANLWLTPHFGIRLVEVDYTYSQLPNAGDSVQNGLRIAAGLSWRPR